MFLNTVWLSDKLEKLERFMPGIMGSFFLLGAIALYLLVPKERLNMEVRACILICVTGSVVWFSFYSKKYHRTIYLAGLAILATVGWGFVLLG